MTEDNTFETLKECGKVLDSQEVPLTDRRVWDSETNRAVEVPDIRHKAAKFSNKT